MVAATTGANGEWEAITGKLVAYVIVVAGVVMAIWLMFRNEPFREPMLAYALRIFLTLAAGVTARVIPGMFSLNINESETGKKISATGAIGFAALVYLTAPVVAPNLDPENVRRIPPEVFPCRVWQPNEYVEEQTFSLAARPQSLRVQWVSNLVNNLNRLSTRERDSIILVETAAFPNPYRAFNAAVRTIPAGGVGEANAHEINAFLVHGSDGQKSFTPLVAQYAKGQLETSIIHVPETQRGDYLFFMILLKPGVGQILNKGELIPFQLFVL